MKIKIWFNKKKLIYLNENIYNISVNNFIIFENWKKMRQCH